MAIAKYSDGGPDVAAAGMRALLDLVLEREAVRARGVPASAEDGDEVADPEARSTLNQTQLGKMFVDRTHRRARG